MEITEIETSDLVSGLWSPEGDRIRTPGLHLTDILYPMMKEQGEVPDRPDLTKADLTSYQSMGFIWERIITRAIAEAYDQATHALVRPGEISKEGIIMSPDALFFWPDILRLEEWKATYTSSRKAPKRQWIMQIAAYCYALGLYEATLRILYICGNWRPPVPRTRMYNIKFTERDLWENWQEIINFGKSKGIIK